MITSYRVTFCLNPHSNSAELLTEKYEIESRELLKAKILFVFMDICARLNMKIWRVRPLIRRYQEGYIVHLAPMDIQYPEYRDCRRVQVRIDEISTSDPVALLGDLKTLRMIGNTEAFEYLEKQFLADESASNE